MTRVLALDLSLAATGICTVDGDHDTIRPHTKGDMRLWEITTRILDDYITDQAVHFVVLEDVPFGMRNAAAGALGMLHGAIRHQLLGRGLPYMAVPPATLKTYATGRGNAKKPDMRMELFKRTGMDLPDDNQVDARWLWYLAHDLLGEPVLDLPQTHRRALLKLNLPEGVTRAAV